MICPYCSGAVATGTRYCAGCLLLAVVKEGDTPALTPAEAPPCELLSVVADSPKATTILGEQMWPVRRLVVLKLFKDQVPGGLPTPMSASLPYHSNIAPVLEVGIIGGRSYSMTPYLAGGWTTRAYPRHSVGGRARLAGVAGLADALALLHARGIAHGRITPGNVLSQGHAPYEPQIVDFEVPGPTSEESTGERMRADVAGLAVMARTLLAPAVSPRAAGERLLDSLRTAATATDLVGVLERLESCVVD